MRLEVIKKMSEKRTGGLKKLAVDVGMSEQNLHRCIRNNKIQADDLEKIANLLGVPVSCFFDEDVPTSMEVTQTSHGGNNMQISGSGNRVSVPPADDTARMQEKIKYLENMVAEKEKMISEKERIIRLYEKMEEGRK